MKLFINDQDDLQGYINAAKSTSGPVLYFGISADNLGTGQKAGYLEEVPDGIIDESKLTESCLLYIRCLGNKTVTINLNKSI